MGQEGRRIIGMDPEELITLLNKAYADEWLAYYQYWLGAKVIHGPTKEAVIAELEQHAADELRHADMLTERILQLGGTPLLEPKNWYEETNCGYEKPEDPSEKTLIEQNLKGERCAIKVYSELLEITKDTDPITHKMVLEILADEVEHEDDLENLLSDFKMIKG